MADDAERGGAVSGGGDSGNADSGGAHVTAWQRLAGKGIYPAKYAIFLLLPFRGLMLSPTRLIRRMGIGRGDAVLEIGCGPGYFSPAVARHLREGKLVLFDYQDAMLDIAERRLRRKGLTNYERHQGDAKALPFADASFDAAFLVTVLGEVGDPARALSEAARVLRPGGRLSVSELTGDPDYVRFDRLKPMAEAAGLTFERRFGPRFAYTANFVKAS
ncbi:MAG TPA: methyltransferase domain-containing protein [Rhizomicrobium sp.]|nr:methyltransferase domain-containing protein [Rhizomicrobium sp.]